MEKYYKFFKFQGIILISVLSVLTAFATCISLKADETTTAQTQMREARKQPTVPDNYKELPFIENSPKPKLNPDEKKRGYMLFQRPVTEPVYPNTNPLPYERLKELRAFAAQGEFEPLTFSVYPTRELNNFNVKVSDLKSSDSIIPASEIDVRLVTYWNIGYPRYTSRSTYRRLPELLEKVTAHTSPPFECQRWWLTVHVPENTLPGIYTGKLMLKDDKNKESTVIPIKFRVLDFKLLSDPNKHYSAYIYLKNHIQYNGKSEKEARRILNNEYKAMKDMGLNMCPTFYLRTNWEKGIIYVQNEQELQYMLDAGLKGPIPLEGGNAIEVIYKKMTPGGKRRPHWKITKMPPPEFYAKVTEMFTKFKKSCKAKGWPEVVCCALDEVHSSVEKFGAGVYKAVHDAGVQTYITKNPQSADASKYAPGIDIWCSQPYSMPYKKIVSQKRYKYWSYPNHNAGEIKDRLTMCKGGRMTYGYGSWRSGYTTLIPWHWAWVMKPDQFDYLRSRRSGCGQRIDDNGEVIPSIYWECFREGIDDARYIYTLEQAIWERKNSKNPECRKVITEAEAVLQKQWNDIKVQEKYLRTGMWNSEEFNARRWQLATFISKLIKYPATRKGYAPSVIINTSLQNKTVKPDQVMKSEIKRGNVEIKDLSESFAGWKSETSESEITTSRTAGANPETEMRWVVNVNHKGGEKGYPVGWPRIRCYFKNPPLDFTKYDYLKYIVKIDSNRDEVADDVTPLGFTVQSNKFFEVTKDIGGRQRVWIPIVFNIHNMIDATAKGEKIWQNITMLQLFIAEKKYKDKTKLIFDIKTIQLLRFKTPVIVDITTPSILVLPIEKLPIKYKLMGTLQKKQNYTLTATLLDTSGKTVYSVSGKINKSRTLIMNMKKTSPGKYHLKLQLSVNNNKCSSLTRKIIILKSH